MSVNVRSRRDEIVPLIHSSELADSVFASFGTVNACGVPGEGSVKALPAAFTMATDSLFFHGGREASERHRLPTKQVRRRLAPLCDKRREMAPNQVGPGRNT